MVCGDHATTAVAATEASISLPIPGLIPPVPAQRGSGTDTGQATQSTVSVHVALTTAIPDYPYLACVSG